MLQSSKSQNSIQGNVGMFSLIKTPMTIALHIEMMMQSNPTENITLVLTKMIGGRVALRRSIIGKTMTIKKMACC